MATIYERIAVCSDTTWNALSGAVQAEYDDHFTTWANYLASTKTDLVSLNSGCREVVIWCDETMPLPRYNPSGAERGTEDANNFTIIKAHSSARHDGNVNATGTIKFDGFGGYSNYTQWDGIIFDQSLYSDPSDYYYADCYAKNHKFENCILKDLYGAARVKTYGWFKNCLLIDFRNYWYPYDETVHYNCGFYTLIAYTDKRVCQNGTYYNCWAHTDRTAGAYTMFYSCLGDNNYATDGSGPTAARTISTFGFTDAANLDFSITSSSPLFDAGATQTGSPDADVEGNSREQGASVDIGPYEVAVQTQVTLSGVGVGSTCSIVDLDNGGFIVSPFVADSTTEVMEFPLAASANVSVRVRHASGATKYLPWKSDFLLTSAGATLYVTQMEDAIA